MIHLLTSINTVLGKKLIKITKLKVAVKSKNKSAIALAMFSIGLLLENIVNRYLFKTKFAEFIIKIEGKEISKRANFF